jgi:hypothetical protein
MVHPRRSGVHAARLPHEQPGAGVAAPAQDFSVACQVSLEEYMACAVGGCAGCAVEVRKAFTVFGNSAA